MKERKNAPSQYHSPSLTRIAYLAEQFELHGPPCLCPVEALVV